MSRKWIVIAVATAFLLALLAWLFIESIKPLPGESMLQDGRDHLPEGTATDYKFNPPTSGSHYATWISKGFYDEPRIDGNLVHSLEHGYIIIWYNCEVQKQGLIPTAYAQGMGMTAGSEGSASAKLEDMPEAFRDGSCDNLKTELKDILQKFGPRKLIAVPRVDMDRRIILTAWGKMLKLDTVDQNAVKGFIDAYRDNGPETTNEP